MNVKIINTNIIKIEYNVLIIVHLNMDNMYKINFVYNNVLEIMLILNKVIIKYAIILVNIIFKIILNIVIHNVMVHIHIMLIHQDNNVLEIVHLLQI